MKESLSRFLDRLNLMPNYESDRLAGALVAHIQTREFSALYDAQRTPPAPAQGVDFHLKQWSTAMSTATDEMTAAITNLQSQIKAGGVTADQVNTQIVAAVTPLTTQIQTILSSEGTDESKLADVQAELAEFTTAFAPAAAGNSSGSGSSGSGAAAAAAKA